MKPGHGQLLRPEVQEQFFAHAVTGKLTIKALAHKLGIGRMTAYRMFHDMR